MINITATRRLQFCAGHRVHKHESKCRNIHGHNYVAFFHARGKKIKLDDKGRVIDFSVLKEKIGQWIDYHWDHGFIYNKEDKEIKTLFRAPGPEPEFTNGPLFGTKNFELPNNPTAENMATFLLYGVCPKVLFGTGVQVYKIVLWETENCFAEVSLEE